jgi:uncharacterized membrane protein YqjE
MNRLEQLAEHSKDYARLLLTISENRVELLALEMQEELHRLLLMIIMILGMAVLGLLAGITLTAALVMALDYPPALVLFGLTAIYIVVGLILYWRLTRLLANWRIFEASINEIQKDRQWHEESKE